jgi:pimeloyl-ACP methyl ester carboxylesterase
VLQDICLCASRTGKTRQPLVGLSIFQPPNSAWYSVISCCSFKTLFMPFDAINGVKLYWELSGSKGDPIVFIHGSWGDHHNWDNVTGPLSDNFRVLSYDRRGHSQSERLDQQGNMEEDVADLVALLRHLDIAPAHIIGNSGGAAVALKTAAQHPALFRTLVVHEPALFGILKNIPQAQPYLQEINNRIAGVVSLIEKGENEEGAKRFVETIAFGPGTWNGLPSIVKETFIYNAPTFLDETKDPDNLEMNIDSLLQFTKPALLTSGTESAPFFPMVLDQLKKVLPNATRKIIEGTGHVPHLSHPQEYIRLIKDFCDGYAIAS